MASQSPRINDVSALISEHLNGQQASKNRRSRRIITPAGILRDEYVMERFIKGAKIDKLLLSDTPASGLIRRVNSYCFSVIKTVGYCPIIIVKGTKMLLSSTWKGGKYVCICIGSCLSIGAKKIVSCPGYIFDASKSCLWYIGRFANGIYSCTIGKLCTFIKGRSSAEKTPIKSKEELKKESELTHKQQLYQDLGLTKTSRPHFFSGDVKYDHFLRAAHANPAILLMAIMLKLVREGYNDLKTKLEEWEKANTVMKIMGEEKLKLANHNAELQVKISENDAMIKSISGIAGAVTAFIPGVGQGVSQGIQALGSGINSFMNIKLNLAKEQNQANIDSLNSQSAIISSLAQGIVQEISQIIQTIGMLLSASQENLRIVRECNMATTQNIR